MAVFLFLCSMMEYDTENMNSEEIYSSLRGVTEAIQSFSYRSQEDLNEPLRPEGKRDDAVSQFHRSGTERNCFLILRLFHRDFGCCGLMCARDQMCCDSYSILYILYLFYSGQQRALFCPSVGTVFLSLGLCESSSGAPNIWPTLFSLFLQNSLCSRKQQCSREE